MAARALVAAMMLAALLGAVASASGDPATSAGTATPTPSSSSTSSSSTTTSTPTSTTTTTTSSSSTSSATSTTSTSTTATLPTLKLTLSGKTVTVAGDAVSGAVDVVTTNSAKSEQEPVLFHLDSGVSQQQFAQAQAAVNAHHGDLNYLDPYGQLVFNELAPPGTSSAQTVLAPGNYYALDTIGKGTPPSEAFSVSQSSSPAKLPAAAATITTIEFAFQGPKALRDGELVRAENDGFLVHMDAFGRVRSLAAARRAIRLLRAGRTRKASKLFRGPQGAFAGPLSTGSMQQAVLNVEPGFYVQFCVMKTQDGRGDIRLGMERIFRVLAAAKP